MKKILCSILLSFGLCCSIFAQGLLAPSAAPAPTMKTLAQMEPRTAIPGGAPFTISQPGSYYLTGNLPVASGNAITIAASGVTLDLGGFAITSTANPASGSAIVLGSSVNNVTILHGSINGAVTYVGGGGDQYTGAGFVVGINYLNPAPANVRVSYVNVEGCDQKGIDLGTDYFSTAVDHCNVRNVGDRGINAGTISDSTAMQCGGYGLFGNVVINSIGYVTGSQDGIYCSSATNCLGYNIGSGAGVNATTAIGCWGGAVSGSGILSNTATSCNGTSTSGAGVTAASANGCYGISTSGNGVSASTANNCYGQSSTGFSGISAVMAFGCYGVSVDGLGLDTSVANSCYGKATGNAGYAIQTKVANNCFAEYSGSFVQAFAIYAQQFAIGCYAINNSTNRGILTTIANNCSANTMISAPNKYNMP